MKFRKAVVLALLGMLAVTVVLPIMGCDNATNSSTSGGTGTGGTSGGGTANPPSVDSYETVDKLEFDTAKSGNKKLPFLTKDAVKKMMLDTKQSKFPADRETGIEHLQEKPSYTAPYSIGKVKQAALDYSLARLNNFRRMAGLSSVELDESLNEQAQYNAFLVSYYNSYDAGAKPSDMPDDIYKKGKNINTALRLVQPRIIDSSDYYLEDMGNSNLGHRFPLLKPDLKKVGFGVATPYKGEGATATQFSPDVSSYSSWEYSNPAGFDWDFISWPTPGYFPINLWNAGNEAQGYKCWSVNLNPHYSKKYGISNGTANPTEITVVKNGTEKWSTADKEGYKKFTYRLSNAARWSFVFELPGATYSDGDKYTVTLLNVGGNSPISYTVEFFDVNK